MSALKEHKKIVIVIAAIILIPFVMPIIELLIKMIFTVGQYIGTNIRYIVEGKMC